VSVRFYYGSFELISFLLWIFVDINVFLNNELSMVLNVGFLSVYPCFTGEVCSYCM